MTEREYKPLTDANSLTADQRFAMIRGWFLAALAAHGHSRAELYQRPRANDPEGQSEEEIVRAAAETLHVPLRYIEEAIERAFRIAGSNGKTVSSFRFVVPQIHAVCNEHRESNAGSGPINRGANPYGGAR